MNAFQFLLLPFCSFFGTLSYYLRSWVNSSSDMLACANPSCRAAICIDINPALSIESAQKLALQYRQMLATAHATTCPFRSDAERWLLDEERKKQSDGFVLPPYLIPVSNEFVLLEDLGAGVGGLVARKMIRTASLHMSEYLENANMGLSDLDLSLPQEVIDLAEKASISFPVNDSAVHRLSSLIFSVLAGELQEGGDCNSRDMARVLSDDDDFPKLATNLPLLAAFGWRIPSVAGSSSADDSALIECPLCLARVVVSTDTTDEPPTKRQRTGEMPLRRQTMDLLNSHRRYCPYVCGSRRSTAIEAVPGWKAILAMIIKQYHDSEKRSYAEEKGSTGEKTFHSIRTLLRSDFASPNVPEAERAVK